MERLERTCSEFASVWMSAFKETSDKLKFCVKLLRKDMVRLSCYLGGGKRPRYYHTSIEPKRHNRTRKKQRLTRLQRKWKRRVSHPIKCTLSLRIGTLWLPSGENWDIGVCKLLTENFRLL